jgi:drug/metabolite transporter (DMT)-like permease
MCFAFFLACMDLINMTIMKKINLGTLANPLWLLGVMAAYVVQPLIFLKGLNFTGVTYLNLGWDLMSDILVTALGVFYFRESMTGLKGLALLFAGLAVTLFAVEGYNSRKQS